jgi:hypothetical protein
MWPKLMGIGGWFSLKDCSDLKPIETEFDLETGGQRQRRFHPLGRF